MLIETSWNPTLNFFYLVEWKYRFRSQLNCFLTLTTFHTCISYKIKILITKTLLDQKIKAKVTVASFNFKFYRSQYKSLAEEQTWLCSAPWSCSHCRLRSPSFSANIVRSERRARRSSPPAWGPDWHRKSRRSSPLTMPVFSSWESSYQ